MSGPSPALFADPRQPNLQSTVTMVEDALVELGHFLNNCRRPVDTGSGSAGVDGHRVVRAWRFVRGSATIDIAIVDRDDFLHLRVASTVVTIPIAARREQILDYALTANATLSGCAFALAGNKLLVVADRSTLDLDRSEVRDQIARVSTTADAHDDLIVERFAALLGDAS